MQEDSFVLEEESAIYNMVIEGNRRTFAVGQFDKLESNSNVQIYEGCKVVGTIPGEVTVNVAEGCSQAQVAESYKELFIEKVNEYLSWYDDIERVIERAFEDTKTQSWDDADDTGDFDKMIQGDAYADYYTVSVGEAKEIDAEITAENANLVFNNANVTIIPAANNVAEVNGTGYETLEEAFAAAILVDNFNLKLLQDVQPTANLISRTTTSGTIDLNGHTITTNYAIQLGTGGDYLIKDGSIVSNATSNCFNINGANVTLEDVNLTTTSTGNTYINFFTGGLTISKGTVINTATHSQNIAIMLNKNVNNGTVTFASDWTGSINQAVGYNNATKSVVVEEGASGIFTGYNFVIDSSITNYDISIMGGYFSYTGGYYSDCVADGFLAENATIDNVVYRHIRRAVEGELVATVNGTKYYSLGAAIAAANGDEIILQKNLDLGTYNAGSGTVLNLNLNGYTINTNKIELNGATLSIKNGTVNGQITTFNDAVLTIENATVQSTGSPYTISGNNTLGSSTITLKNGARVINDYGIAVYHPQNGTFTAEDGCYVKGDTALYAKRGNIVINGGTFIGTAEAKEYAPSGNGAGASTGAAVIIDNMQNYTGTLSVAINGGTFTATDANAPAVESDATGMDALEEIIPATSTAVFSSDVSALAEDGYKTVYDETKGGYVVEEDVVDANNGANLALEGIIEENIYMDADAYNLGDDAVIKVTYNASTNISETADPTEETYLVKNLTPFDDPKDEFDGTYKFSFKQAPAQITEDVTVALYADANAQEPVKSITYSVKDYCDNVIATSNNAKLVALCKSILDYGMAAQEEFEYNLNNPAETDGFYNAAAIEALTYSDITGTRLEDSIGITGCAFQCLANTNINLYIDNELFGAGIINAYVEDGNDQAPVSATYMRSTKTGRLFISVNGIAADDMTKDFTVVTSNNGSVTTNLNTIVKTCLYYGTATTLAKTIYFYADAANTYFN